MAGIFAVLALSLNLLLGYTGQLSLGHAAFFGIGAYASALLSVKLEWSPWLGLLAAIVLPGAGRLRHRPARAQAARRLLRAADDLVRGLRLAGERELDGPDQRAARHPGRAPGGDRAARAARAVAADQERLLLPGAGRGGAGVPALPGPHPLAGRPRAGGAAGERDARRLGGHRRDPLSRAGRGGERRDGRLRGRPLRALHALRQPGGVPLHLHGHDGDHGGGGREGHAGRARGRRGALHGAAGGAAGADLVPVADAALRRPAGRGAVLHAGGDRPSPAGGWARPCAGGGGRRDARGPGSHGALRRRGRAGRRELRGRPRHGDEPDRPQRRGQDHRVQRDHRVSAPDPGDGAPRRPAHHRLAAPPHRGAGPRAHVPEDEPLPRAHGAGERAHRPAPARARGGDRRAAGPRARAGGGAAARRGGGSGDGLRGAGRAPRARRPRRSPTASSGCSSWRWAWPRGPGCCCSTSRRRA